MGTISVRLFGSPEVVRDGVPAGVDTRKAVAVLAVLALAGHPVRRDILAGLLWPDVTQERARGSLRRTLSSLRSLIGAEAVVADRETVSLALDTKDVDVLSFLELADAAPAEAVELYRGPLLEGFSTPDAPPFEDWQRRETERLRLRMDDILDRLVEATDLIDATRWARQRVALDPLNEAATRQAMSTIASAGDRAGAVSLYRELVRQLDDELGVQPLDETVSVYERVRRGIPPAPPRQRPASSPLRAAGGPTPLVGRDGVLDQIDALVPKRALIVVIGEAGSGRTSVLRAWANRRNVKVISCHPGEQSVVLAPFSAWVPDGPHTSEIVMLERLAGALGLDRDGVIVIDDLDLADPKSITFLTYVLHRPERFPCTIVASACPGRAPTSMVWDLRIEGQRAGWATDVHLGRLDPIHMRRLVHAAGIDEAAVVDKILEFAEGVPLLAVEYARSDRVDGTVPEVLEHLLMSRLAGVSSTARQLVEVLGLVGRPLAEELLRAISGRTEDEFAGALSELVEGDLIRCTDAVQLTQRALGIVACSELTVGRLRAVRRRLAVHLPPAEAAEHAMLGGDPARAAELHRVAASEAIAVHANATALSHLRAALASGVVDDRSIEMTIGDLEVLEGRYDAARQTYETSAARAVDVDLVRIELRLAQLAIRSGDPVLAASHLESAQAERPPGTGHDVEFAIALTAALLEADSGRPGDAVGTALDVARQSGQVAFEAEAEGVAALAAYRREAWEEAVCSAESARRLAVLASAPLTEAAAANVVGLARLETGDCPAAIAAFEQARRLLDQHGDRHRLAAVHSNLADALHDIGREEESRSQQLEAARLFAEVSGSPTEGRAELWFLTAW